MSKSSSLVRGGIANKLHQMKLKEDKFMRNKPVKLSTLQDGDKFRIPDGSDAFTTYTHNGLKYGKVFSLFINILDNPATTSFGGDLLVIKL